MDKKNIKSTKNSDKKINKDFKNINFKMNYKKSKIKPKNIFNNNKLFAYQKAQGNFILLKKLIHQIFVDKYYHDKNFYNCKVIEDIINNESTHVVAEFKDYLIFGDDSEFLQKKYNIKDCHKYLPKIFNYYESCSVIFPNYVILPESKYIYKNIQKKQKVIDIQQEQEDKLEKLKSGIKNEKDRGGGKNSIYKLFNTKEINSILGQTNTSNINKIFGINYGLNENEKSESMFNNIIKEFKKVEERKTFKKKNINLIKKKCRIPSLNLNNAKGLMKQFNVQCPEKEKEKEKENNYKEKNKKNYKKKTYIIINKQNNNLKHFHIKKKSLSKKNDNNKSNLILNNSKKLKNNQKSKKENKTFATNENNSQNLYNKIPKSKLSIDLEGIKKHMKIKSTLNEQEIFNQKGISFFNDILKKKILKRKISKKKNNTSIAKSSSKNRKKINSFIPSQKQLYKLMNKENNIYMSKSIKKNKKYSSSINYSSPSLVKGNDFKKGDITRPKVPIIHIKDSNSTSNILKNNVNLTSSRSRSLIRKRGAKKGNTFIHENNNENLTIYKEIASESNLNINTMPITERDKSEKKIYFTIVPHINNMINLNKIKYMIRASSKDNIVNSCNNDIKTCKNSKISKNIKNKLNEKNNMINKKKNYYNKNIKSNNIKKKSNSIKTSYKNSNTQISSSIGTAACSYGKNSHLIDFETIKVYQKKSCPYPNLIKSKNINDKMNNNYYNCRRNFSLSPDKVQSKELVKKMLLKNPISNDNYSNKIYNNKLNIKKKVPLYENNKKQKNVVLPIRKEKDLSEIKIKDMISLILNNKEISNNYGNISRNTKIKHPHKEKSIISISNRTNNSINTNESIKKSMISVKTYKNSNSKNKNKNKYIYPNNKTYYGYIKNNK